MHGHTESVRYLAVDRQSHLLGRQRRMRHQGQLMDIAMTDHNAAGLLAATMLLTNLVNWAQPPIRCELWPALVHLGARAVTYGPYPFEAVGAIVDDAKEVGYSLETQTKPVFYRVPDEETLAHEISHMWFGDSVTLTEWPDIWLHEGFATWSEWIWSEHNGRKSAHHWFKTLYNTPAQDTAFWTPPPGDPGGPAFMFNGTIYNRGAMTLQALREKIGDTDFFELLGAWASQNRYGNVTTPEVIALAEKVSGQELDEFFDVWLYRPEKPTSW
jgi:aminopeptidase N